MVVVGGVRWLVKGMGVGGVRWLVKGCRRG